MQLRDVTFVVVDTETTGTRAERDRVLEIGAVKVEGGRITGRYQQLVNPGRAVPRRITEITGISTGMVFDQPAMAAVMPDFLDFLGDGVFVAHNAPFDKRFLDAELKRLGQAPLPNPVLCTLRLARRLLPGLRSKGLSSVADFYGIRIRGRHRAWGDAEATAEVLIHFLSRLGFEHEIDLLEELLSFQFRTYRKDRSEPRHLKKLRQETLGDLPDRPGVYFMRDGHGAILYIGKAKSLKNRVRSYFTGIEGHAPRTRKLVDAVREVTWEETGSELAALLRESRLIKEHQPRFNRALRRYRNRPFIRLDTSEAFPRVSWSSYLMNDGAEYFGPLGGRGQAELVIELINRFFQLRECDDDTFAHGTRCLYADMDRCLAPCVGGAGGARYGREVQRVRDFLMGRDPYIVEQIEARMREAAHALDFEQAALFRDWMRRLERMQGKQQQVAAPVLRHNAVLIVPGHDARVQLLLVRFGRYVEALDVGASPSDEEVATLRARLAAHFDARQERPDRYFKQEVDEVRILAHWLYVHRDEVVRVDWTPALDADAFLAAVLAALRAEDRSAAA